MGKGTFLATDRSCLDDVDAADEDCLDCLQVVDFDDVSEDCVVEVDVEDEDTIEDGETIVFMTGALAEDEEDNGSTVLDNTAGDTVDMVEETVADGDVVVTFDEAVTTVFWARAAFSVLALRLLDRAMNGADAESFCFWDVVMIGSFGLDTILMVVVDGVI